MNREMYLNGNNHLSGYGIHDINKINGIDKIMWINLDRSPDRRNKMVQLLNKVNIKNKRVKAIDGKEVDVNSIIKNMKLNRKMDIGTIATTLSHIKAVQSLKYEKGNYFMVCEDDIHFDNTQYFQKDLKTIIKNAPHGFDILMLYKTWPHELKNEYERWIDYYKPRKFIAGACCYIISKKGVEKINKYVNYINDTTFHFNKKESDEFHLADVYLFKLLNTWVYKYNFIATQLDESTLHNNDIYLGNHRKCHEIQQNIIMKDLAML